MVGYVSGGMFEMPDQALAQVIEDQEAPAPARCVEDRGCKTHDRFVGRLDMSLLDVEVQR